MAESRCCWSFGQTRQSQAAKERVHHAWAFERAIHIELLMPSHPRQRVVRYLLEDARNVLACFFDASGEGEAGRTIAQGPHAIGPLPQDARRPLDHLLVRAHAVICDHVRERSAPAEIHWIEPLRPLLVLDRLVELP